MPSASGSLPFVRSASPFVRLETTAALGQLYANIRADVRPEEESNVDAPTQEGRETPNQEGRESRSSISEADLLSCRSYCSHSEARSHSTTCRPSFVSPRSTDYCCAICIELLLRPVVLSCGHRLCRGCWVRVLQGSQARAIASRTGSAACPLGRCEVRPCVPEVDQDLESKMRSRLGFKQLATHAATAELAPLDEESAAAAAVNAWAAAGCKLDHSPTRSRQPAGRLWRGPLRKRLRPPLPMLQWTILTLRLLLAVATSTPLPSCCPFPLRCSLRSCASMMAPRRVICPHAQRPPTIISPSRLPAPPSHTRISAATPPPRIHPLELCVYHTGHDAA